MKLTAKLSPKQSLSALFLVTIFCIIFLGWIHYELNLQYPEPAKSFSRGPVTSVPKSLMMNLDQPDDNSLTFQSSVIVSGKTAPSIDVLISTATNNLVIKSKPDGSFSTVLDLDEGENKITVIVFDTTGDSRSSERTVFYSKEKI